MEKEIKISLNYLAFVCLCCGKEFFVAEEEAIFYSWEEECGMCGSHGEVSLDVTCPHCNTSDKIILSTW